MISLPVPQVLWTVLWFWLGASYSLPLIFSTNLYWSSAVSVIVTTSLGFLFALSWLYRPIRLRSSVIKWTFLYLVWVSAISLIQPYVWENIARSLGFFVSTVALLIALLLGTRFLYPNYAFIKAGRAYVIGAALTTCFLIFSGEVNSIRFGNDELLHPNSLGFLYGSVLAFLISFGLYRSSLLQWALCVIFIFLLVITLSKTSIIAMVIAVGGTLIFRRGWEKARFIVTITIIGGVVSLLLQEYIQTYLTYYIYNPYMVSTLSGRTVLWTWVIDMIRKNPWFGYGYATFRDIFAPYALEMGFFVPATQAHNAYLDALFTSGYPGLLLFVLTVVIAVRRITLTAIKIKGTRAATFLIYLMLFVLTRSTVEGTLNLGRDFILLIGTAFLSESWAQSHKRIQSYKKMLSNHEDIPHPQLLPTPRR